jgi:hypothetical protein
MSGVRVETEIDLSGMNRRFSSASIQRAQRALSEKVGSTSNKYIPLDTGALKGSMHILEDSVIWGQPYAQKVYYLDDARIRKQKNADAHSHWFEHAKSEHVKEWQKAVEDQLSD